jgi:hypothetical protein
MNELITMGSERLRFEPQLPVLLLVRRPRDAALAEWT